MSDKITNQVEEKNIWKIYFIQLVKDCFNKLCKEDFEK